MRYFIVLAVIYIISAYTQGVAIARKGSIKHTDLLSRHVTRDNNSNIFREPSYVQRKLTRRQRFIDIPKLTLQGLAYDNLINNALSTSTEIPTSYSTEAAKNGTNQTITTRSTQHSKITKTKRRHGK
ncbi:hypothetical protein KR018_011201, partial [Drosophila ironensis]